MPNAPTDKHQDLAGFLFDMLNGFRYARGGGPVRQGTGALVLSENRYPQPDVFVKPPDGGEDVPALLTIEILSPSTRVHDLHKKSAMYREHALPELWFLDMEARLLKVERREADGAYSTHCVETGVWAVASLPGFWVDASWLWDDPLPNPRRCLDLILAGLLD